MFYHCFKYDKMMKISKFMLNCPEGVLNFPPSQQSCDKNLLQTQHGNFVSVIYALEEPFNFNFVVELIKFWAIFHSHIKFSVRHVPENLILLNELIPFDKLKQGLFENILDPLYRLPVNPNTEAELILIFGDLGYEGNNSYETQEYFMSIQQGNDFLTSFEKEFDLIGDSTFLDTIVINETITIDLISGVRITFNSLQNENNYLLTQTFLNHQPEIEIGYDDVLFNTIKKIEDLFHKILLYVYSEKIKVKLVSTQTQNIKKRKTLAIYWEIKIGHQINFPFQILFFLNLNISSQTQPENSVFNINKQDFQAVFEETILKRAYHFQEILASHGNFLSKTTKTADLISYTFVPKLSHSLSNILVTIQNNLLSQEYIENTPTLFGLLSKTEDQVEVAKVFQQSLYQQILNDKLS